jgi:hypothetical protein
MNINAQQAIHTEQFKFSDELSRKMFLMADASLI